MIIYIFMFKEIHFHTIASTHLFALEHLGEYKNAHVFISADSQTAGIGRKGDPWISTTGNLMGTFIFPEPKKDSANLAQLLSFSAIKVLEKWALTPLFKWPNDILLSHKKAGGILVEIKNQTVIASIGINVNMTKESLDKIDVPATSLFEELRQVVSLSTFKRDLITQFSADLSLFGIKGFEPFFNAFASKLAFIGKPATVGCHTGKIEGLATDGRLILTSPGKKELIASGSLEIL
jgi:BirA family biotin operon repressor/biotin-[acetyl-CoA-carboxylase] ligase